MIRYSHHLGDYATATAELTMLEHGAYRLLLDHYYRTERALTLDLPRLYRVCGAVSEAEQAAVQAVLAAFFENTGTAFEHRRCEEELAAYRAVAERNRINGKAGGRPPKDKAQQKPTGFSVGSPAGTETGGQTEPYPSAISPNPKHEDEGDAPTQALTLIGGEQPQPVATLAAKDGAVEILQPTVDTWAAAYPALEIRGQLARMAAWLEANPTRRPTAGGMKRFCNGWLSRAQDKAASKSAETAPTTGFVPRLLKGGGEALVGRNVSAAEAWLQGGK